MPDFFGNIVGQVLTGLGVAAALLTIYGFVRWRKGVTPKELHKALDEVDTLDVIKARSVRLDIVEEYPEPLE